MRRLPPPTDEEIEICLIGGDEAVILGYQQRTGATRAEAIEVLRRTMADVYAGRRRPQDSNPPPSEET